MGVPNFALSDDNKTYAASCLDSKIRLVDRDGGEILKEYSGHRANNFKLGVAYNKGDAYILSGSDDGSIFIYDILKENFSHKIKNHCRAVSCIDMHPLKTSFLSSSFDNSITLWTTDKDAASSDI